MRIPGRIGYWLLGDGGSVVRSKDLGIRVFPDEALVSLELFTSRSHLPAALLKSLFFG